MSPASDRNWQVHYNRDQDIWRALEEPVTVESLYRFIDPVLDRVDVYLIDAGSRAQYYPTRVTEMIGADEQRWQALMAKRPEGSGWEFYQKQREHFCALVEQVGDPIARLLDRCREKGVVAGVSHRMNDRHYGLDEDHFHFTRFCVEHRDWRMSNRGFDFIHPEVREESLSVMKEICEHFDLDVFELNFGNATPDLRTEQFFRADVPPAEQCRLINEMVQEVRAHADRVGQQRGRRLAIQARVPSTADTAWTVGMDLKTWVQEGWVDALIPAPSYAMESDIPAEEFKALDPSGRLKVLVGIEGSGQPVGRQRLALVRGAIAKYARRGADGVHFFNSFCWPDRSQEYQTLDEAHAPGTPGKTKHYLAAMSWRPPGKPDMPRISPLPAAIPAGEGVSPLHVDLYVADDLAAYPPAQLRFRVQLRGMDPESADRPRITVNGNELAAGAWRPACQPRMGESRDNDYMDPWLEFKTHPEHWRQDKNVVAVKLHSAGHAEASLRGMELDVIY